MLGKIINEKIRHKFVTLIDNNGENRGIVAIDRARFLAIQQKLDLVLVDQSNKSHPICKIADYGKMKYAAQKKQHHVKQSVTKQIKFGMVTALHDLNVKRNHAKQILQKGNKVKFTLQKGKFRATPQQQMQFFNDTIMFFDQFASWDPPVSQGKYISSIIKAKAKKG